MCSPMAIPLPLQMALACAPTQQGITPFMISGIILSEQKASAMIRGFTICSLLTTLQVALAALAARLVLTQHIRQLWRQHKHRIMYSGAGRSIEWRPAHTALSPAM